MSAEIPLQSDMFSGKLVDTRSTRQKARDREREKPQQSEMFSQREIAQFGVRAHPQMSLSAETRLVLISEDPRTPEEIERDRLRAADELTISLFAPREEQPKEEDPTSIVPVSSRARDVHPLIVGFRIRQRYVQAKVRRRKPLEETSTIEQPLL